MYILRGSSSAHSARRIMIRAVQIRDGASFSSMDTTFLIDISMIRRRAVAVPARGFVVVVVDPHIQRIALGTEETTTMQQVSHRPIKY